MTSCYSGRKLAADGVTYADSITNANTVELVPAVAGHLFRVTFARIQQSVSGTTTCVLKSNAVTILVCGTDDVGEAQDMLIDGEDLSVVTTGTGTSHYAITIVHL